MGLEEEINQKLRLPKPSTIAKFEAISNADDSCSSPSSSQSERSCRIRSRNPNLFLQSDTCHEKPYKYEGPNEHDITASIIEAHGGKTSTNQDEVEIWKTRVEKSRLQQLTEKKKLLKEAEEKRLKEEEKTKEETEKIEAEKLIKNTDDNKVLNQSEKKPKFKRNVLMRTIVQNLELGEIPSAIVNSTSSGKNDINNHENTPMLKQSLEDPDFYYLRDTSSNNFDESDDFRFEHRGVKKTVTPRHYALHEIPDECFKFRRN
ncbi:uncharacterized protein [Chelonus insularis]|uniref:uncharacterized protein n=1 Tax=Chelonus insularis TaxID=460826 RepID=UPI00158DA790|nr:uncharacterized protein LOC118068218 [Chelonus insularis]XP_034941339.1 uncharacterized protein LOC118068218 [Chelonus insularis]XP_034941341.1 uncharacterized protein LOC118068218 [Chelonus insularis]